MGDKPAGVVSDGLDVLSNSQSASSISNDPATQDCVTVRGMKQRMVGLVDARLIPVRAFGGLISNGVLGVD